MMKPEFLDEAALSRSGDALDLLLLETRRLVAAVFEVAALGVGLERACVDADLDLDEAVRRTPPAIDVARMERCRRGVHTLCGAIVVFASRMPSSSHMTIEETARVHSVRLGCRAAVDVLRDVAALQPNVSRYIRRENPAMHLQYAFIRRGVARCLRRLAGLISASDPGRLSEVVATLERDARRQDALADGTVHRLLRGSAITPAMAADLMIDSARALGIERKLAAIAACVIAAAPRPAQPINGRLAIVVTRPEASWSSM
jgi:hypothetical protein